MTETRRGLSASAHDRLRRYVLLGLAITGMVLGASGAAITIEDGALDPAVVGLFAPDIAIGIAIVWLVARCRVDTAVRTYAVYFAINYAFFALHAGGYEIFATPWVVLPPVFGFYLGGRRLGLILTAVIVAEGLLAVVVHLAGIGYQLVELPPLNTPDGEILMALEIAEILILVAIFESRRERMRLELDRALHKLDEQTQTMLALVESTDDVILFIDERHRVVLHNGAARDIVPAIDVGVSAVELLACEAREAWTDWLAACTKTGHARTEHVIAGRTFELSFSRVSTGDHVIGFTLIARDITVRRDAEAALRKVRGQLLDASRRAAIAETTAALLHNVGNALNGAATATAMIAGQAAELRADKLLLVVDELDREVLATADDRSTRLRAYLRKLAEHLALRKTSIAAEASALRASIDDVATALATQHELTRAPAVFDDVSLDEIVASALTVDDCRISRNLAPTPMIVTHRQRLVEIVARLFEVCHGDGMHVTLHPVDAGVSLAISPALPTALGDGIFAHGRPLHAAAIAAAALGGSLRCATASDREVFLLELPRVAPGA